MKNPHTTAENSSKSVRPRPAFLRALGKQDPPSPIEINGRLYWLKRVFKHDSWAATGLYSSGSKRIVCKFNRQQGIGLFSMKWLGRWLAARECYFLRLLCDLPNTPNWTGDVYYNNRRLRNAVAHDFVEGHPLQEKEHVRDDFFPVLRDTLYEMHRRKMAYVDLHKRENIIVGENGLPYLIDFQIGFSLATHRDTHLFCAKTMLDWLQHGDRYHFLKHWARCRPDTFPKHEFDMAAHRPAWIKVHRKFAQPFRSCRRWLLSCLNVRNHTGRVETEHFAEESFRSSEKAA